MDDERRMIQMAQIELCAFDIDGVLVDESKELGSRLVPAATQLAIRRLRAAGVLCTTVSGRGFLRTREVLDSWRVFKPSVPLIVEQVKIVNLDGSIVHAPTIDPETIQVLSAVLLPERVELAGLCPVNGERYCFWTPTTDSSLFVIEHLFSILGQLTSEFDLFFEWMAAGTSMLFVRVRKTLDLPSNLNWTLIDSIYYFRPLGHNKGTALAELARQLNLDLSQVAVFVNDLNDLPMAEIIFRNRGIVVVVGEDPPQELIQYATRRVANPSLLGFELSQLFPEILGE